jgi:predicted GIY-YIG superfamily endonuclease
MSISGETQINKPTLDKNNYLVYLLTNTINNCTYIGCTNNPTRRLRQHNGDLVGGAKYTKIKKEEGEWKMYGYVSLQEGGFLEKRQALSIEKKIQIRSRKTKGCSPLDKRLNCISKFIEENPELKFNLLFYESKL